MVLWIAAYLSLYFGLQELRPLWLKLKHFLGQNRAIIELRESVYHLKLLQELLESGMVPEAKEWKKVDTFPKPWGGVLTASLTELRSQGAPVLPSLIRMQKTLEEQIEFILESKVKSSQAFGQAAMGMILVPVFSLILYLLLPGIQDSKRAFFLLVLGSFLLSSVAFIWMMNLADRARFGNMPTENRKWLVSANASLERVLALISTGLPPDLAWRKAMEELAVHDPLLVGEWKAQVWDPDFRLASQTGNECERLILQLGIEVRRSIQTSLIEGRACLDRIESIHQSFLIDLKSRISKELNLLPNRCLKPLFIFVLPSVMILMMGSFAICFSGYWS